MKQDVLSRVARLVFIANDRRLGDQTACRVPEREPSVQRMKVSSKMTVKVQLFSTLSFSPVVAARNCCAIPLLKHCAYVLSFRGDTHSNFITLRLVV